jgi:hypothetical protein
VESRTSVQLRMRASGSLKVRVSDLTYSERRKLERFLRMDEGYVLDFSNRTFEDFFDSVINCNIYDRRYENGTGSKANRLKAYWKIESNGRVAKVIEGLIAHRNESSQPLEEDEKTLRDQCTEIVSRLVSGKSVDVDAFAAPIDDENFETLAKAVRDCIEKDKPEEGLDRLHTFVTKFVRMLCGAHGIQVTSDKPLHSLFGEYVKQLRTKGHIESGMTERILRSSISVLDAFNDVRNNKSLAHDNPVLNHEESDLIFNHVASSIRFLKNLEIKIGRAETTTPPLDGDDIPF